MDIDRKSPREADNVPNPGMRSLVPPINGEPSPHGLLGGCIPVVNATDPHHLNGTDLLPTLCTTTNPWQDCPTAEAGEHTFTNPSAKIFNRPESTSFSPITAYAGFECSTVGMSFTEARDAAVAQLLRGEQVTLESFFMRYWLANTNHTTDLTPGAGAVHIVNGIGLLETWLAGNYGGQGVIHAPIGTASLLAMHRQTAFGTDETCLETLAGNSLILGAGYSINVGPATPPAIPAVAPAGEAWLYITPPMRIRQDEIVTTPQDRSLSINTSVNDQRYLAERTFVPEVACGIAAAVRVTLAACC